MPVWQFIFQFAQRNSLHPAPRSKPTTTSMNVAFHLLLSVIAVASADAGYIAQQSTASSNSSDCSYACTDVYVPVCGSDGVTYPSECSLILANCENQGQITQVSDGECSPTGSTSQISSYEGSNSSACPDVCPMIYKPVCGSDGVTYSNDCILGIAQCESGGAITQVSDGQCPNSSTSSSGSATAGCPEVCFEIYEPVCGSDGVTYANSCFLGIATCNDPSITQASDGACVASEGSYGTSSDAVSSSEEGTYGEDSSTVSSSGCVRTRLRLRWRHVRKRVPIGSRELQEPWTTHHEGVRQRLLVWLQHTILSALHSSVSAC